MHACPQVFSSHVVIDIDILYTLSALQHIIILFVLSVHAYI